MTFESFILSEERTWDLSETCPAHLLACVRDLGVDIDTSDFETNGWEQSYWADFEYQGKNYRIWGCMWYGTGGFEKVD